MVSKRGILLGSAIAIVLPQAAFSADLPPIYEPVVYQDVPEVVPVEIGTGWYLRGDIGYQFDSSTDANYREYRPDFGTYGDNAGFAYNAARYGSFDGGRDEFDVDGAADFGAGFGYQFTDFFRGDLTANYWKSETGSERRLDSCFAAGTVFGSGFDPAGLSCDASNSADIEALELMANAYVDLGTFLGFTPYLGGGVGAARIEYKDVSGKARCSYAGDACQPGFANFTGSYDGEQTWRFAYSLMAGVSYDVSQNMKIDVGYRFTDIDDGKMFSYGGDPVASQTIGFSADDDGFQRHAIRAGIRYSLW